MAAQSVASVALAPPPRLPDLFPVLVSATAYLHFLGTFVYFNVVQFSAPPGKKSQKKMNWLVPRSVVNRRCFAISVSRRNTAKRVIRLNATLFHSENNWNADRKDFTNRGRMRMDWWRMLECWHILVFDSIALATDPKAHHHLQLLRKIKVCLCRHQCWKHNISF